jgi:hypothetical protein
MRTAHIVTTPHEVGDRVLALCGKDHKVKQMWGDIPDEAPICRECVDLAVAALDEADDLIQHARRWWRRTTLAVASLGETLTPDDLALDAFADEASTFTEEQAQKQQAKADRKKAQRTCTCTWTDLDNRTTNPDCPIHGHGPDEPDELPPVAPPME